MDKPSPICVEGEMVYLEFDEDESRAEKVCARCGSPTRGRAVFRMGERKRVPACVGCALMLAVAESQKVAA